jgi:hypothetical protein
MPDDGALEAPTEDRASRPSIESGPMNDEAEAIRRRRLIEINTAPSGREVLEARHGQVWGTEELTRDFTVIGFLAPFVVVIRDRDGQKGSLEFQGHPRFYFNFVADHG